MLGYYGCSAGHAAGWPRGPLVSTTVGHLPANWFVKFQSSCFNVADEPRSERPVEVDKDAIKSLVDANFIKFNIIY